MSQDSAPNNPQIQMSDLIMMLQILQTVANRGAFRLEEFKTVGACYERLYTYLLDRGAIQPNQQAESNTQQKEIS